MEDDVWETEEFYSGKNAKSFKIERKGTIGGKIYLMEWPMAEESEYDLVQMSIGENQNLKESKNKWVPLTADDCLTVAKELIAIARLLKSGRLE